MKKCPYCAEEIQDEAIKCRFCGEYLKKKKKWLNCLLGCLIALLISIILIILFIYLTFFILKFIIYKIFFAPPSPSYYYPPFMGQGIEGVLNELVEAFRQLWGRLMDFFHLGPQNYRITF